MIKDKNKMNILISINSKFIMPAMVMLASLFENNKVPINIYMLYSDLKEIELQKIHSFVKLWSNNLVPIKVNKKMFTDVPLGKHFSIETYFRLLAHELLPNNLERILYLDSDLIVMKNLQEFYNQNIGQNYFVACEDIDISQIDTKIYKNLNLKKDVKYFNAGVLLYNLNLLRIDIDYKNILKYIDKNKSKIKWVDQDVLNSLFWNKTKFEDFRLYNLTISAFKQIRGKKDFSFKNTVILHYAGSLKPWNSDYESEPLGELFWKYTKKTPYRYSHPILRIKSYVYKILNWC